MAQELELLNKYTSNKTIISFASKSKNIKRLKEINSIFINLKRTNRAQTQKDELVLMYIQGIEEFDKEDMKSLVCHSLITDILSFQKQKELINLYIDGEKNMNDIIKECYDTFYSSIEEPKPIIKKKKPSKR